MNSRTLLRTILLVMLVGRFAFSAEGERPNVILIISDEHGFTDFGTCEHRAIRFMIRSIREAEYGKRTPRGSRSAVEVTE